MTILMVQSYYQEPLPLTAPLFREAIESGLMKIRREMELTEADFVDACGLITTTHLDQVGFQRFAPAASALLDRGGRWVYQGRQKKCAHEAGRRCCQPSNQYPA